jgi:chemotaxis protein MotA
MKPDLATIIGFVGGVGIVGFALTQGDGGLMLFVNIPSLLIVVVGSLFIAMMKFGVGQFIGSIKIALKAFLFKAEDLEELITISVDLAEKARKNGIVALEEVEVGHPFLKDAIKQVVDNVDPMVLKNSLVTDMSKTVERHESGKKIFDAIGDVGPAMGMIGTLIGLVQMLANMSDPSTIGPSMAVALLTTLYGAMLGTMVALPIADKLELRSQQERDAKLLLIDAISGIQQGLHPRILQQILMVHLPGSLRTAEDDEE